MKELSKLQLETGSWLEDLFDDAHDLIQIVQTDGTLLFVNNAWTNLLGYVKEDIQGKTIYDFIDEPDRGRYEAYRNQIIAGQVPDASIVFKLRSHDGLSIPVEGVVNVKRVNGNALYTRGIFRDITLRLQNEMQLKRLNQELKEREQNLQQLLLHAPDAVIVIDQESRIKYWNPKAEMIFGWQAAEVLHQSLSTTIIPPQYREAHHNGMKRLLTTGEARMLNRTIEVSALKRSGETFYVALTISSTQQDGQQAFIAFIRDITEQKQGQLELELKTRQLEQSNAYLADFAHAASHDLKEPLRKIRTFTDRLKGSLIQQLGETEISLLERIEASAERMQLLVDDLLEFSHLSEQPREPEQVDLTDKIQKVLSDLELQIEEKKAVIHTSGLPVISGNRRQLQQLFFNLIGNALKYSKEEIAPEIHISSRLVKGQDTPVSLPHDLKEKTFHLIEVRDNGIGFEQAYAEKIFEMFQRLHGKAEYAGTGIGLAIASKVVSNHNGFIWAASEPGEGASFYIMIPG